jgi:hypothetical protein
LNAGEPRQEDIVCPVAQGASMAPELRECLHLSPEAIAELYARRESIDQGALVRLLRSGARHFRLSGVDLLRTIEAPGFVVLEANSAPGFGYCTPGRDAWELAYRKAARLVVETVRAGGEGAVALLTEDKLPCETLGYRHALAQAAGAEVPVWGPADLRGAELTASRQLRVRGQIVAGGLRYLHTNPWELLPPDTAGVYINGTRVDLAGARDKVAAAHAFQKLNDGRSAGLPRLSFPATHILRGPSMTAELPGDWAGVVLKPPHLNSGAGLRFFSKIPSAWPASTVFPLVAQAMVRPSRSLLIDGRVYDLRMVVGSDASGFFPIMAYARLARRPYDESLEGDALAMALITNISAAAADGSSRFEYERLLIPSTEGWRRLGLSQEDFAVAYVHSVLATLAIDENSE